VVVEVVATGGGGWIGTPPPTFGETGVFVGVWRVDVGVCMVAVPVPVVDADVGVCMFPLLGLEFVVDRGTEGVDILLTVPARLGPCK